MSNTIKDGGPAFPSPEIPWTTDERNVQRDGMTLRDWFAGQALSAIPHLGCGCDLSNEGVAEAAYQIADAMLAAKGAAQ